MALAINNFNSNPPSFSDRAKAPINAACAAASASRAYFLQDKEALIDETGKLASSLDLLIAGTSAGFRALIYLGVWLEKDLIPGLPSAFKMLLLPYAIVGLFLSFFELSYEIFNLYRGISLRLSLKFSEQAEDLRDNQALLKAHFFSLNPKRAEHKFQNLVRRVSMPAALEIKKLIDSDKIEDLAAITKCVDIQTRKKLLTHTIGLISILLSTIGYAFLLVTFPHIQLVTLFLALASILFYLLYYVLEQGFVNQKGYNFSFQACIPTALLRNSN